MPTLACHSSQVTKNYALREKCDIGQPMLLDCGDYRIGVNQSVNVYAQLTSGTTV